MNDVSKWIGKTRQSYDGMCTETMKRFAATMDTDAARILQDDPLPPCAHWFYFTPMEPLSELAQDGHPKKGGFLPDIPLPRRMWAGGVVKFLKPLRTGHPATKTSTITSIVPKSGKSGELCFVTVVHRVESGREICIDEEQHIVYREEGGSAPKRTMVNDVDSDWTHPWTPSAVQLFRFSAITFNGHRIHYDADYCRDVEGYPNLVVHGPLLLHKIMESFRQEFPARCVTMVSYRAMGPVFLGESVHVVGQDGEAFEDEGDYTSGMTECRVLGPENNIAMKASINWEENR